MSEQRNIVILGASFGGIPTTHYILKHILPPLKAKNDAKYHVYLIDRSSDWYFRIASPRAGASIALMPKEKLLYDIPTIFKQYSTNDFTFIEASITSLDTAERTVSYKKSESLRDERLSYHALIVATGSKTHDPVYSMHTDSKATMDAIHTMNRQVSTAKSIIIVGGGATGVESAGEIGEFLNGKPGWFSQPTPKARITIITASSQLLPELRLAIGKTAEEKLKKLGVDVVYNTRVVDVATTESGRTTVTLAKGEKLEADLYIPANGLIPNSSFLPPALLNPAGYLVTNPKTLRVDAAGPRIYAVGDIASHSNHTAIQITASLPTLLVNLKRDLFAFNPAFPGEKPKGKDREFKPSTKEMLTVPIGSAGGVGAIFGWRVPNWFVWMVKARDYLTGLLVPGYLTGDVVKKEFKWSREESVV
ncbi:FAD/NAD(P)-binding domain-containing protein [Melanomma pulvis-pyrius CBS 109.77]|uniref:FAD/NAD(P)-binding domain-containing protein n=1 Tax=Melanomma pulvis-pyrius CBS 109.77 TaxID=1314802 RepID=A0A6A6XQZ7_9PLEO|nr:FAD/NAD(P)-binding domain-containing protein [Melanomma pulvis-pyrius CBS 109.77]